MHIPKQYDIYIYKLYDFYLTINIANYLKYS